MDMESSDYEYPESLDNTPPPYAAPAAASPSPPEQDTPQSTSEHPSEQPVYQNMSLAANGSLHSTADDSDSDYAEVPHISIKQTPSKKRPSSRSEAELESSSKIYIEGHLSSYLSPAEARARSVSQMDELVSSLSEQGIYQGLALTDNDKRELGIMPQSIYMATNLMENFGSEIEQLSLVDEMEEVVSEGEEGQCSVEEGEMKTRLGSKTDPNIFKPKIRKRQLRACKYYSSSNTQNAMGFLYYYRN